jgi:hypothetical protein
MPEQFDVFVFEFINSEMAGISSNLPEDDLLFTHLTSRNVQENELLYPGDFNGDLFLIKFINFTPIISINPVFKI